MTQPTPERLDAHIKGAPVRVVDLVKQYDTVRAVDGVSFNVDAGEFLALIGPSGSGKTTILMSIAGFVSPTSGEVYISGQLVTHLAPYLRKVGMVFQKYALFPHMTVWENIAYPLRMRKMPPEGIKARVEAALEMIELNGYGHRWTNELSGGQQQRVALARAIVYRPPILLMDEPLGALDRKLRQQMQLEIKRLQRRLGATVIYVTHDQDEALTIADRIGVLNNGSLEQIGTPEELYERPRCTFVADFIGETNFLKGVVKDWKDGVCIVAIEEEVVVEASAGDKLLPANASVRVAVRPERVTVCPLGSTSRGCVGEIQETVYTGASVACIIRLTGTTVVTARVPTGGGQPRWSVGDTVEVTWRPEDARIYEVRG